MSGLRWLGGRPWSEITREERAFCAELYCLARADLQNFIEYLNAMHEADLDVGANWEMAFEASFYRDQRRFLLQAKDGASSDHRKFDLALFSDEDILIIEAKAQQGFGTKQLDDIRQDPDRVKLRLPRVKRVRVSALVSSRYFPKPETRNCFTGPYLTWRALASFYDGNAILRRADEIYRR